MSANVYSEFDAIRVAMRDCEAKGGTDCQGVASITNGCVALAISDDGASWCPAEVTSTAKTSSSVAPNRTCKDASGTQQEPLGNVQLSVAGSYNAPEQLPISSHPARPAPRLRVGRGRWSRHKKGRLCLRIWESPRCSRAR